MHIKNILFIVCLFQITISAAQNCIIKYELAQNLYKNKNRHDAIKLMDQVVSICKKEFKSDIASYYQWLSRIGKFYKEVGEYNKAEPLYVEIEHYITTNFTPDHPDYIRSINNLSTLYQIMQKNTEAEVKLLNIKKYLETYMKNNYEDIATNLSNLGNLYKNINKTQEAIIYLEKSCEIYKYNLNENHQNYPLCLYNLAETYMLTTAYIKSESLYLKSQSLFKNMYGEKHINYAKATQGLAKLYIKTGNFSRADEYFTISNIVFANYPDEMSPDYLSAQINLAEYYRKIGNYARAEMTLVSVIQNYEKSNRTRNPDYIVALYNLALVYIDRNDQINSEKILIQITNTSNNFMTENSVTNVKILNILSEIYLNRSDYKNCEDVLKKLQEIYETNKFKHDLVYARILIRFAKLNYKIHNYTLAEINYLQAINIYKLISGEENQDYITILFNLGCLYEETGKIDEASSCFLQSATLLQNYLYKNLFHLSTSDAEIYIESNIDLFNRFNSFIYRNSKLKISPSLVNFSLILKNVLLSSSNYLDNLVDKTKDSSIIQLWEQFKQVKDSIANYTLLETNEKSKLAELTEISETQEKELKRKLPEFQDVIINNKKNWIDIRNNLKTGEVAIDIINFKYYDQGLTDTIKYIAYIIKSEWNEPRIQFLFNEEDLSNLVDPTNTETVLNRLYKIKESGSLSNSNLYKLIWQPLEPYLTNSKTIYLSLTGLLHRISYSAIPLPNGQYLNDKYDLRFYGNLKEITKGLNIGEPNVKSSILFGGINYESEPGLIASDFNNIYVIDSTTRTLKNSKWTYLKGTLEEVNKIKEINASNGITSFIFSGANASEEQFRQIQKNRLSSPYFIHFATHGYSFNTRDSSKILDQKLLETKSNLSNRNKIIISTDALSRSGLIMSGANKAWQSGVCYQNRQDGILTAREISNMDLRGCHLVTLSACETGLGELKGSEGVFGLQRAFRLAGVKYQIVSLWKVPDKETSIFMQNFYDKWLTQKMTIYAAFRETQSIMSKNYKPYQWAAFILVQ